MPDSPRPSISFPAFQTPAGLHPQADREHQSDYSETQGQAAELSRRTDGYWIDLPYAPSRFGAPAPSVWAVEKKDILALRYKLAGSQASVNFYVNGSITVAAAAGALSIELPERLRARQTAAKPITAVAGGAFAGAFVQILRGARRLTVSPTALAAWPLGGVTLFGQIVIEVEEV